MPGPEGGTAAALSTAVLFLLACAVAAADQSDADRAAAVYRRAQQLESAGDHAAALPLLWEAAGLAPRDSDIQNRLGEALERLGALDAALDAYRAALAVQPGFRKARNNLILALGKAGRSGEAVELARADAAASPRDADRQFTLGLALAEADVEAAVRTFRRVLALSPRHVLARYNLALVLKRADRLDAALDELQRVLEIEPRAEAHYTRGVIYWHQGDVERATAALRAALALQPAYVEAHHTLGTVLQARGDLDGASAALRRAVALRPDLRAHTSPWRVRSRRPERSTKRGGTERRPSDCASGSAWSRKHASGRRWAPQGSTGETPRPPWSASAAQLRSSTRTPPRIISWDVRTIGSGSLQLRARRSHGRRSSTPALSLRSPSGNRAAHFRSSHGCQFRRAVV